MSIQRWHDDGRCFRDPEGDWVTYADHVAEVERVREKQQARDYATLWSRLMLEDKKYAAALARAALVIRGRLTDADVQRITGSPTCLHQWEDVGRSKKDDAVEAMRAACIEAVRSNDRQTVSQSGEGLIVNITLGNKQSEYISLDRVIELLNWAQL